MNFTSPGNKTMSGPLFVEEGTPEARGSDRYLLAGVFMLMMFGILAVYSSIAYFAEAHSTTANKLVIGHIVKLVIAFVVMIIFSKLNYWHLKRFSRVAVILSWVFLIIVALYGNEVFGARRYLNVAGFSFQPSSFASVALLIHLVVMLTEKKEYIKDFKKSFVPIMIWISITCLLIGIEDFSSAALLMAICFLIMFIGRVSVLQLGAVALVGLLGAAFLLSQSLERQSRISNYFEQVIHIKSDEFALAAGYQAQQAHIAIAKGGFFGVGVGKSTQRDFLPAPYNDFIFAIIAEEYGLIGAGFILLIFVLILIRGVVFIARNARDEAGAMLAVACTLTLVLYGFVNAAVACGLFPVTGLPMPFVSYGGTSMLFSGVMVGILLNISKYRRDEKLA